MISTPVKDVKSLMNFMGGKSFTKAGNAAQAGSFGDVMNMAGNNANQSLNKPVSASQATEKKDGSPLLYHSAPLLSTRFLYMVYN